MMRQTISSVMVACAGCVFLSGISLAEENLVDSLVKGKPSADIRYRYEVVDQTGKTKNADAHTVRTRLGYGGCPGRC